MAPKGSPRMLHAATLLASSDIPVKVALSRAGFSAEEIAKEKKQRQARRRRDFLLKKMARTKIKGRRSMATLPQSLPRQLIRIDKRMNVPMNMSLNVVPVVESQRQKMNSFNNVDNNHTYENRDEVDVNVAINSNCNSASSSDDDDDDETQRQGPDTSRLDALIFACSMQEPLSGSFSSIQFPTTEPLMTTATTFDEMNDVAFSTSFSNIPSFFGPNDFEDLTSI